MILKEKNKNFVLSILYMTLFVFDKDEWEYHKAVSIINLVHSDTELNQEEMEFVYKNIEIHGKIIKLNPISTEMITIIKSGQQC